MLLSSTFDSCMVVGTVLQLACGRYHSITVQILGDHFSGPLLHRAFEFLIAGSSLLTLVAPDRHNY